MLTYLSPRRSWIRSLAPLSALFAAGFVASVVEAQERRYRFEVGAAAGYQSFDSETELGGSAGGLLRAGVWLPYNFSVEAEGALFRPNDATADESVSVRSFAVSALYNLLVGTASSGYVKLGYGSTSYGDTCPPIAPADPIICGSSGGLVAGLGFRLAVTPLVMIRTEGALSRNRSRRAGESIGLANFGVNVGVSVMLGSQPIPDSDADGILNNRDRCPSTPSGAQVNDLGCPADSDGDGVANGIDRCPGTGAGAIVDAIGCTRDSDDDNIADGIDKCPDSPAGVLVDSSGCPRDTDADGIADGLDRCSATPKGATVDALGCPGDEDADGVLDGLDRCPRTSIGATVNSRGCAAGQRGRQQAAPPPADTAVTPPLVNPTPPAATPDRPAGPIGGPVVLEGVTFESGSARLRQGSYVELDSVAKVLLANPRLRIEISGHTDNAGTPAANQHLSTLRAEAVRNYLLAKGVPYQQMVARGYGSTVPRTPDTTPQGLAANRRVEIRPLPPEP
jgi:outer membrane protein OmpA-like peptidoglycan-associated protein